MADKFDLNDPPVTKGRLGIMQRGKEYDEGRFFFSQPYRISKHLHKPMLVLGYNPPPENCNTHLFLSSYAIRRDAILADAYSLLAAFIQKDSPDFSAFKEVWLAKNFSLIHLLCPTRSLRDKFMFALYQTFFTFLYEESTAKFKGDNVLLHLKIGVIYALYMLYHTQPTVFQPSLILVDANQWDVLNKLHAFFGGQGFLDVVYAFGKLKESNAFKFSLYVEHNPFYYQQSKLGYDGFLPEISDQPRYQKATEQPESRFHQLDDRLKELEDAVANTKIGGFIDETTLSELEALEDLYEDTKSELVGEEIAPGLNESISNTLMVPGFQQWLATLDGEPDVTASMFIRHLVTQHLEFKGVGQNETHAASSLGDAESEALDLDALESMLREQIAELPSERADEDPGSQAALSGASSPAASSVYSFGSD